MRRRAHPSVWLCFPLPIQAVIARLAAGGLGRRRKRTLGTPLALLVVTHTRETTMIWATWYALLLVFPLSIVLLLTKEGFRYVQVGLRLSRRRARRLPRR